MKKNRLFGLVVVLGVLMGINNLCFADCDISIPAWHLPDTNCQIFPFYYESTIIANSSGYVYCPSEGDPYDWDDSESSKEYWTGLENWAWNYWSIEPISCGNISSTYSSSNEISLHNSGVCWSMGYWNCDIEGWCSDVESYWDDKTFIGYYSVDINDQNCPDASFRHYDNTTTVTAIFDRDNELKACLVTEPNITTSDYEATMHVRPQETEECPLPCDGSWSGVQTISITCNVGSHIKNVKRTISGCSELIDLGNSPYIEVGCEVTHENHGSITIAPNHDKVILSGPNCDNKTATVTYSFDFYDSAGNGVGSGSVSVLLTTEPAPKHL